MLIDNTHTFLSGHSLVHLLTPKCLFHLRRLHTSNFKCFDADMEKKVDCLLLFTTDSQTEAALVCK